MGYYDEKAEEYASSTFGTDMSAVYSRFLPLLPMGCSVLDVGSGSGRDSCAFLKAGYCPVALEPSPALCNEIRKVFPGEVVCSGILEYSPSVKSDAVWACASLLHLKRDELLSFFSDIDRWLKPGGYIYASFKSGIQSGFDDRGRYFENFTDEVLEEILACNGQLSVAETWNSRDVTGRDGFEWVNLIFQLSAM